MVLSGVEQAVTMALDGGDIAVIERTRQVCDAVERGLRAHGDQAAAEAIRLAGSEDLVEPEELLALRSALVKTRPQWEKLPDDLVVAARSVLRNAKRHAIEEH